MPLPRIALGGGCHWCTEGVFATLRGVVRVEQGWVSAPPPDAEFSEAVIVHYDPEQVSLKALLAVHLHTHSATSDHALRTRYRSAVYVFAAADRMICQAILDKLAVDFDRPLLTRVLDFVDFRPSLPEHQNYYYSDPERPFCQTYIKPKLDLLVERFPGLLARRGTE
jgi:peptide-methionine (S)-S-oxide reductase